MLTKVPPTGGDAHQAPSDQFLGYKLLIELMAHQFAFPVQWIDTQKKLLQGSKNVQRVVEIGPAEVLTRMAKKTADKLTGDQDLVQLNPREFLFIGNDEAAKKIEYEYESANVDPPSHTAHGDVHGSKTISNVPTPQESTSSEPIVAQAAPAPAPIAPPPATSVQELVVDVDVTAADIIQSIVAHKLGRGIDRVPADDSIRTLSSGKSVLQNELIGDLSAEFGDLPQGSEELAIKDLGARLSASGFAGKPGKVMKKLLERMFSLKMPAGFGQAEAESHMQARWGLGPKRQTAVLCLAIAMQPPTRLEDAEQARQFWASAVGQYAAHAQISLPERSASANTTGATGPQSVQVDAASLDALKKDQNTYLKKQLQILSDHLNVDLVHDSANSGLNSDELIDLRERLSSLQVELEDEFMQGIQGVFDAKKQRKYASWWNWAREDVLRLLHSSIPSHLNEKEDANRVLSSVLSTERLNAVVNRWNPKLETILKRYSEAGVGLPKQIANALLDYHTTLIRTEGKATISTAYRYTQPAMAPRTSVDSDGKIDYTEVPRGEGPQNGYFATLNMHQQPRAPYVHLRSRVDGAWHFNGKLSQIYMTALSTGLKSGLTFSGKTALVTGAGPGSIGSRVVGGLLAGGAKVIVTTNRAPATAAPFFAQMYKEMGSKGSELVVLPFNAASVQDCEKLVAHVYDKKKGLGADLDYVVPFAAVPENGRELDQIDARSELAHRAMLTNVLRLLGCIKQAKERGGVSGRPAAVILPLSPNHGDFGGDGLYSESKLGLETLFNRFSSESWSSYISIVGAVIGWTRGTGLMNANDIVAQGIEDLGVLTFTAEEMALNILTLLSPKIITLANQGPVYADLSGGLLGFEDLKKHISSVRADITTRRSIAAALAEENRRHNSVLSSTGGLDGGADSESQDNFKKARSNIRMDIPELLPHAQMVQDMPKLQDTVDLSRTVVVVGFSELGPWGSSRTRWQRESQGQLDQNGYTELAWIMGLIKHGNGVVVDGQPYFGWVDTETGQAVHDADIPSRYGKHILSCTGIRNIEPGKANPRNYDPSKKEFLQEIVLDDNLPHFEASEPVARSFKARHGDKVTITPTSSNAEAMWTVAFKKGATFHIPKTAPFHQTVAAQLPNGWDPATYGIPEDIVAQVDPVTLYALCCVSEAIYSAGIEDVYELYKHIHVAELGNYIGSGAGGLHAMQSMYRDRYMDKPVQGDVLQETFLNSMAAWTNMLLLGSTGPIKTPVGACATAVESLDTACEAIRGGRVKAAFVGGVDDFGEEASYEFDSMKATANAADEKEKGFLPSEMSRPTSSSRAGFVEAAGAGVQLVMTAELALKMGLPIRAIVAYSQMSGDGIGRSLPAPGRGVLTAAREIPAAQPIKNDAHAKSHSIEQQSPMRTALSTWGLSIDDVAVASFHGTSTKANDINESQIINDQMRHLGRKAGNPLLVVCQKHLTGHPKGAAAAWQLNGCMQMLESGVVPGNRNADDVDAALEGFEHLVYPSEAIEYGGRTRGGTTPIKACMLTSFGFGQKGGMAVVVSPRLIYASLAAEQYRHYQEQLAHRRRLIDRAYQQAMMNNAVFRAKDHSVWVDRGLQDRLVFLNPSPLGA